MRRRLQWEASAAWQGDPAHKLDPSKLQPVISLLLQLALPALHHKSGSLRAASLELLSNAMYVEPDIVLPVVVQRFHEALEASDSVHQLSGSIRLLCCAFSPLSKFFRFRAFVPLLPGIMYPFMLLASLCHSSFRSVLFVQRYDI